MSLEEPKRIHDQDFDLNGNRSNQTTRETARTALENSALSKEQRQFHENATQCARGDQLRAFRAADEARQAAARLKGS
jgi:hypothetical protein